jgi:hypothetical protein
MVGSGEVPQDELGPWFPFEEADGELYDVLGPVLICPLESVLDLDPLVPLVAKNSKGELLPTLLRIEGLKRPERLDISPSSSCVEAWFKPVLEPFAEKDCSDWLRGLTEVFSTGLGNCWVTDVGEVDCLAPLRTVEPLVIGCPGRRPNLGNSNEKLTSLGLFNPPPRALPARYGGNPLFNDALRLVPFKESLFRYSRNSIDIFSICARKIAFS